MKFGNTSNSIRKIFSCEKFKGTAFFTILLTYILIICFYDIFIAMYDERGSVILEEDGLLEYLTALFFILAIIPFLHLMMAYTGEMKCLNNTGNSKKINKNRINSNKKRGSLYRFFLFLYILTFFLIAMEEISWGQRLFNWETTGWFSETNTQGETNIHNSKSYFFNMLFYSWAFTIGVLIPYLHSINEKFRRLVEEWNFPFPNKLLVMYFIIPFLLFGPGYQSKSVLFIIVGTLFLPVAIVNLKISKDFITFPRPLLYGISNLKNFFWLIPIIGITQILVHQEFLQKDNAPYELREFLLSISFVLFSASHYILSRNKFVNSQEKTH